MNTELFSKTESWIATSIIVGLQSIVLIMLIVLTNRIQTKITVIEALRSQQNDISNQCKIITDFQEEFRLLFEMNEANIKARKLFNKSTPEK